MSRVAGISGGYALRLGLRLAADIAWIEGWSNVLGRFGEAGAARGGLPPWLVGALVIFSAVAARLIGRGRGQRDHLLLAALGVLVALTLGAVAAGAALGGDDLLAAARAGGLPWAAFATAGAAAVAWWRGLVAGRQDLDLDHVEGGFREATLAMIGLVVLSAAVPPGMALPTAELTGRMVVVLASGFVGLPLARLADEQQRARRAGAAGTRLDRAWLVMLGAAVVALLVGSALLASVLTFERIDLLLSWLAVPLTWLLWFIIMVLLMPVALLVDALIEALRSLLGPVQRPEQQEGNQQSLRKLFETLSQPGGPEPEWVGWARLALIAVGAVLLVYWLTQALRGGSRRVIEEDVEEERDFVWSWRRLRDGLRHVLQRREGARPVVVPSQAVTPVRLADRSLWTARDIYRALLALGARRGRRREPAETPREYAVALATLVAPEQPKVAIVTALYEAERYGEVQVGLSALAEGLAALEALEATATAPTAR